jgi:hypothetical protein
MRRHRSSLVHNPYRKRSNRYGHNRPTGEYTVAGATINTSLISFRQTSAESYFPTGIAVSGSNLFITLVSSSGAPGSGEIGEYTMAPSISSI